MFGEQHLKYDAFISYKRQGGQGWAELVWMALASNGKEIFIDHSVSGGTQHPLISELRKEIDKSMNVIVVIFEGIQDVLKSKKDIFLQELQYARSTKKNIIPFYVDGLSSSILKSEERFKNLPPILKNIVSGKHSDICYFHGKSQDWMTSLIKSFETEDEVRLKRQYLVSIQAYEPTTVIVRGVDGRKEIAAGVCMKYWVNDNQDFWSEVSSSINNGERKLTYRLVVDPKSSESYYSAYKQRKCIDKDKKVEFTISWKRIEIEQLLSAPKPTDFI